MDSTRLDGFVAFTAKFSSRYHQMIVEQNRRIWMAGRLDFLWSNLDAQDLARRTLDAQRALLQDMLTLLPPILATTADARLMLRDLYRWACIRRGITLNSPAFQQDDPERRRVARALINTYDNVMDQAKNQLNQVGTTQEARDRCVLGVTLPIRRPSPPPAPPRRRPPSTPPPPRPEPPKDREPK